jgi:hypothetical protein
LAGGYGGGVGLTLQGVRGEWRLGLRWGRLRRQGLVDGLFQRGRVGVAKDRARRGCCGAGRGHANSRVGALGAVLKLLGAFDGNALVDNGVCSSQITLENVVDDSPAVGVALAAGLVLEVDENAFAVLLDVRNVLEKRGTLGVEHFGSELGGGRGGVVGGVKGVEHGETI